MKRWVLLLISAFFMLSAFGQQDAFDGKLNGVLRSYQEAIEERARKTVGKTLDDGRFILYARVSLDNAKIQKQLGSMGGKKIPLWTLPQDISDKDRQKALTDLITTENIAAFVKSTTLELTFDSSVPQEQISAIENSLEGALSLKKSRGDLIKISRASLASPGMQIRVDALTRDISRLESSNLQLEQNNRTLDLKTKQTESIYEGKILELSRQAATEKVRADAEKSKADEATRQLTKLEAQIVELKDQLSIYKTPLGDFKKLIKGLEVPLTMMPIALLIIIALVLLWTIYQSAATRRTQRFMEGLQGLSSAIQKSGKSIGGKESQERTPVNQPKEEMLERRKEGAAPTGESLTEIKEEAQMAWNSLQKSPFATVSCLKDWLAEPEGLQRFMMLSRAIGAVAARELHKKLPKQETSKLRSLVFESYTKAESLGVIVQLDHMVQHELSSKPSYLEQLNLPFLNSLTDNELANAIDNSSAEASAFVLVAVTAKRCSRLLELVRTHTVETLIAQIRDRHGDTLQAAKAHSEEIRQNCAGVAASAEASVIDHITEILEMGGPRIRASLGRVLESDENLAAAIKERMLTIDDVIAVDDDILAELLDPFEPQDVAVLATGLTPAQQKRVIASLNKTSVADARDEFKRISSKPASLRRAQAESQQLQNILIQQLRSLIEQGVVDLRRRKEPAASRLPKVAS